MSATTATTTRTTSTAYYPQNGTWLPTVDREGFDTQTYHHHHDAGVEIPTVLGVGIEGAEGEEEVEPEVRYRVRFTDASLGPSKEKRVIGQEAHESPPVHVRITSP